MLCPCLKSRQCEHLGSLGQRESLPLTHAGLHAERGCPCALLQIRACDRGAASGRALRKLDRMPKAHPPNRRRSGAHADQVETSARLFQLGQGEFCVVANPRQQAGRELFSLGKRHKLLLEPIELSQNKLRQTPHQFGTRPAV